MSTDRPPDDPLEHIVFFVDRALGRRVAEPLREAGEQVELHDDHFPQGALDIEWIPLVAERRWVVLTKDKKLRARRVELMAIHAARLRVFTLPSGNLTGEEMGERFRDALHPIKQLVRTQPAPFIGKVYTGGRANIWLDADQIEATGTWRPGRR